ncbi:RNA polymerase sigma-70 factor [uncultured Bacteroides sp.]|uniref:RNA polymerase sigma factor n=1 Tax=uncultured Bacteroides sp. TaxID=162156 RepID=UPI002AA772F9|nr:RNA polymerase sigma-70 factor [uncultured Bacteroides sp.]
MSVGKFDEESFTSLFYLYKDKLYGFFLGLTHSPTKSEDLVQEVFMRIWQKREELTLIDNLNAYIYRAAQNHAIDQIRKRSNEILLFSDKYLGNEDNATAQTPLDLLLNKELSSALTEAIEQLPPQQKKVFTFHCIEGLPHEEIARLMDISVSTVQNHMRQALINIRTYFSGNYPVLLLLLISIIF